MKRWEHCVVSIDSFIEAEIEQALNEMGNLGWELVTVRPVRNDADLYVMKRVRKGKKR